MKNSSNSDTADTGVRTPPLPLDFPYLGLGNLAISQPSRLNVLHQAAACFSCYDIRDIAIHVYSQRTRGLCLLDEPQGGRNRSLRWLGHVLRMPEDRLPHRALFSQSCAD
ncbi:hypothetical protein CSKR_113177 [Clonorchis sinensis]|uniref:Uncharacterized protein n=1 Tax=Clonorchis sinensis TaxID=79923 RepID=A0A3R7F8B4_CLOSI|nr:hypothetical protein CSKR_113177 [Clonorchis sinensis]